MALRVFPQWRDKKKELNIHMKRNDLTSEKLKFIVPGPWFLLLSQSLLSVDVGVRHGWYAVGLHS